MTTVGNKPVAFEFATATRIVFGAGKLREVGAIAKAAGNRALVVAGRSANAVRRAEALLNILPANGLQTVSFQVEGEPTVDVVRSGTQYARDARCNLVIGFGGGSVIDAGKAIAALLTNDGDPLDYLEVIGKGKPVTMPSAPFIAVPTTAGTGAEVTRNAVLGSHEHRVKVSMRSPFMLPRVALVDPELTLGLPKEATAFTGLDALTQLIEPFVCNKANPLTDAICREGMRLAARSLRRVYENGEDLTARSDMATASLFGGLALANAGLGAVHGFAAPLGGMFPAPHGAVCAALLPHVMEMNVRAADRTRASETLGRYEEVARILTGNDRASIPDGVRWASETCQSLKIRPLRSFGVSEADFAVLIEKASLASSMKANPIVLAKDELREILQRAF
jgi:alcohol dehydrogenase class IV